MGAPKTVAEARKQQQLARLDKKSGMKTVKDAAAYAKYYAAQPFQVERAALYEKYASAVKASKEANEVLAIAQITGDGLEDAKHNAAVADRVAQMAEPERRGAGTRPGLLGATT